MDATTIVLALSVSLLLQPRLIFNLDISKLTILYTLVTITTLALMVSLGLYRAFLKYVSAEITKLTTTISIISAICLYISLVAITQIQFINTTISYFAILFLSVSGSRYVMKNLYRRASIQHQKNVVLYGAGNAASQIMNLLRYNDNYRVKFLIDDDITKVGKQLLGRKIKSLDKADKLLTSTQIDLILIAIPSASKQQLKEITSRLVSYGITVKTLPNLEELIDGNKPIMDFRDLSIDELLGREERIDHTPLNTKNIKAKNILVTGAGGSIGSELCRQLLLHEPKSLVLLDVSEKAIYDIMSDLGDNLTDGTKLYPVIGSVLNSNLVRRTIKTHSIQNIYHAAAYKHVPLMEENIFQAIINNTIGTNIIATIASEEKVKAFTLISTDKAVNPTNVMGASKRLAELLCLNENLRNSPTIFSIVRFGNVLGSSGSVVPLFKHQIENGGPLTITDPEVTRYFMSIPEAASLVLRANALANGGEIFVLDMGEPVKIIELARNIISLSGLIPILETENQKLPNESKNAIVIKSIGLRPGEKMFEELSYGRNLKPTVHPKIFQVEELEMPSNLELLLGELNHAIDSYSDKKLNQILRTYGNYSKSVSS